MNKSLIIRFGNLLANHLTPPGRELLSGSQIRGTSGKKYQRLQGLRGE